MSNVHLFYQNQALPLGRDTNINCFSNTNFRKKRWTLNIQDESNLKRINAKKSTRRHIIIKLLKTKDKGKKKSSNVDQTLVFC